MRHGLSGLATLLALLGAGFVWFAIDARRPEPIPPRAGGIVVLTGGAGRIELGLRLLAEQRADLLLISGTGPGALPDLLAGAGLGAEFAVEFVVVAHHPEAARREQRHGFVGTDRPTGTAQGGPDESARDAEGSHGILA